MTADDLDRLTALVNVTGVRLDSVLKMIHRAHPSRMISLGDFLSISLKRVGFDERANAVLRGRFQKHADAAMEPASEPDILRRPQAYSRDCELHIPPASVARSTTSDDVGSTCR
jgi:hypothetical protein